MQGGNLDTCMCYVVTQQNLILDAIAITRYKRCAGNYGRKYEKDFGKLQNLVFIMEVWDSYRHKFCHTAPNMHEEFLTRKHFFQYDENIFS